MFLLWFQDQYQKRHSHGKQQLAYKNLDDGHHLYYSH